MNNQEYTGIQPADRELHSPGHKGSIITPQREGSAEVVRDAKCNTVQSLNLVRRDTVLEEDTLYRQAIACLLSEYVDMDVAMSDVLNHVFHKRPRDISFREWLLVLLDKDSGLHEEIGDGREVYCIIDAINMVRDRLLYLCDLDLAVTGYWELTHRELMLPLTAVKFLMTTRPTEHVMLTPAVIEWFKRMPPTKRNGITVDTLVVAPTDPIEYSRIEYAVRRAQRTYYSGLTSYECALLIGAHR